MTDLDRLVTEFAAEFESGGDPDPGKFLARADAGERPALADKLDAYLDRAPTQAWDPGAYARSPAKAAADRVFESYEGEAGTWPELLPSLRERARIKREELTRQLAEALGFGSEQRRVHAYYHQMEHGQIPASGVSDRVLDALAEIVGTTRERLRAAGERVSGTDTIAAGGFARKAFPDEQYLEQRLGDAEAAPPAAPSPSAGPPRGFVGGAPSPGRKLRRGRDELDELFLGSG
jgi:hypothetical protein